MTLKQYLRLTGLGVVMAILMGLLAASQLVVARMGDDEAYTFGHAVIMQTPFWLFWAPIFPLIIMLVQRYPLERGTPARNIVTHVVAGLGIVVFHYGFQLWFMHIIGHGYPAGHSYFVHFISAARWRLSPAIAGYVILLGLAVMRDYYFKYRERELLASQLTAQLSQAKLRALRMQLNPHFLFNALNSIAMLTRRNENTRAVNMLAGLGDLLRYVLEDAPADEVPLRDEIAFMARYLEIERERFGDRLVVDISASDDVMGAFVPNLLLQPLVENAIRHGVARKADTGHIRIGAVRSGDRLKLQVSDDGPGIDDTSASGVGLANTRSRLEQLYGDDFTFDVANAGDGGVTATVIIPYRNYPLSALVTA
jgi:signal transduction histidine kinase